MGRYSVKRYKTKRRTKDLDLIYEELTSQNQIDSLLNQPIDETKPGLGQYYCIHCAKYFETAYALKTHLKTKIHKRRVKELKGVPYTQQVADAAVGCGVNSFLARVEQIKSQIGPQKEENEKILTSHLDTTLANVSTTESTLPYLDGAVQEQAQQEAVVAEGEIQMAD